MLTTITATEIPMIRDAIVGAYQSPRAGVEDGGISKRLTRK
jgi:hypothetical protein